mgnify:CR=1 FL=1
MLVKKVTIQNKDGLRARLAMLFTNKANDFKCNVSIKKDERTMNAKSMLGILSMGIKQGEEFSIITDGIDEKAASESLYDLVSSSVEI